MLKNYVLVAFRQLYRNKYYSLINIVGLGVAMAICVVGYINYQYSQSFNSMYENADNIYVVGSYRMAEDQRMAMIPTPTPLAPAMANQLAGVEAFSRFAITTGDVRHGERVFRENLCYVDANFFEMFSFTSLEGEVGSWRDDPSSAVITEGISRKLFGEQSPVGRQITVAADRERQYDFVVVGVVADPPSNSSFSSGVWINYELQAKIYGYELDSWNDWTTAAFIQLGDGASPAQIEAGLPQFLPHTNEANPNLQRDGFFLAPLKDIGALVMELGGPLQPGMHPAAIVAPSVVALLVLLLACFNFMNTSIAFAARRVREIGVRKVVGGMRSQLVWQFLGESLILCGLALVVAMVLSEIFVPAYDSLWPEIDLTFNYFDNMGLVAFLIGLLLFTGLAAGAYPAIYVSGFAPATIFRGSQKIGGTNGLIRVLLTLQLALAMTAIVAAVILTQNASYMASFDYGYDSEDVYVVPIRSEAEYDIMRTALAARPEVIAIGASQHLMMRSWANVQAEIEGTESRLTRFAIGEDYVETIGMRLLEGRTLDADLADDVASAVMVNRTLFEQQGWTSIESKQIDLLETEGRKSLRVVGLIEDFFPNGMNSPIQPAILTLATPNQYRFLVARCRPGSSERVAGYAEEIWSQNFPNYAFGGFWHEERMEEEVATNRSIKLVFLYIGITVVIISSMGLLALVSLNIARRTREIGIRKVLGATANNIGALIALEFVILIVVGSLLACGLGYFLTDALLSSIWRYYCDFGISPFVISLGVVMVVAVATVGFRVYSASRSNPVSALRSD